MTTVDQIDLGACPAAKASAGARGEFGGVSAKTVAVAVEPPVQTPWGAEQEVNYRLADRNIGITGSYGLPDAHVPTTHLPTGPGSMS